MEGRDGLLQSGTRRLVCSLFYSIHLPGSRYAAASTSQLTHTSHTDDDDLTFPAGHCQTHGPWLGLPTSWVFILSASWYTPSPWSWSAACVSAVSRIFLRQRGTSKPQVHVLPTACMASSHTPRETKSTQTSTKPIDVLSNASHSTKCRLEITPRHIPGKYHHTLAIGPSPPPSPSDFPHPRRHREPSVPNTYGRRRC